MTKTEYLYPNKSKKDGLFETTHNRLENGSLKFATLLTRSCEYMSRTPFSKTPHWAK